MKLSGDLVCHNTLKKIKKEHKVIGDYFSEKLPDYFTEVDPLHPGNLPQETIIIPESISDLGAIRPYTIINIELKNEEKKTRPIISIHDDFLFAINDEGKLEEIKIDDITKISLYTKEMEGGFKDKPYTINKEEIKTYIFSIKCFDTNFNELIRIKPRASRIEVVARCGEKQALSHFFFKIETEVGSLGKKCSSRFDCKGDLCLDGFCARKCENNQDCGNDDEKTLCSEGMCWVKCSVAEDCPDPSLHCVSDGTANICLAPVKQSKKTKPINPKTLKKN